MLHQFSAFWVLTSIRKRYKLVYTVAEAAQVLLHHWPTYEGGAYIGALAACRDALLGIVPAALMRRMKPSFCTSVLSMGEGALSCR